MIINKESVIKPLPSEDLLLLKEERWRVKLPMDYRDFVKNFNGGVPMKKQFICNDKLYEIRRFLCVLKNVEESEFEINVVRTDIGNYLAYDREQIGVGIFPIAALTREDYVCLDYRKSKDTPTVCVWDYMASEPYDPVTFHIAETFTEFCMLLQ